MRLRGIGLSRNTPVGGNVVNLGVPYVRFAREGNPEVDDIAVGVPYSKTR